MEDPAQGSSEFLTATYEADGPESRARATAERICFDQTIEAEKDLLPQSLQSTILGHLDDLRPSCDGGYRATIRVVRTSVSAGWCRHHHLSGVRF
jgi:ribulose-bisphosphate carboxylase large chain